MSTHARMHTPTHTHTHELSDYTKLNSQRLYQHICSLPNPLPLPVLFVVMSIIMRVSECVHRACVTVRLNS